MKMRTHRFSGAFLFLQHWLPGLYRGSPDHYTRLTHETGMLMPQALAEFFAGIKAWQH